MGHEATTMTGSFLKLMPVGRGVPVCSGMGEVRVLFACVAQVMIREGTSSVSCQCIEPHQAAVCFTFWWRAKFGSL